MIYGMISVFFNEDFGYIIAPYTKLKDSVANVVMKQVYVKENGISEEEMGFAIKKAIQKSYDAAPIELKELDDYNFWQISGVKGFSAFSRRFQCIKIYQEESHYELIAWHRAKDGSYVEPKDCNPEQLPLTASENQLGMAIKQMVYGKVRSEDDDECSFQTLNENTVSYTRPGDDFEDMGDGNTDAYQIFTHDEHNKNNIAFLIDNNYSEISKKGIKSRWKQMYGEEIKYHYKKISNKQLKIVVTAKTKELELCSYFYQDGEVLLEVLTEIDLVDTPKKLQSEISMGMKKVIDSIRIM